MKLLEVAVAAPLLQTLTYEAPKDAPDPLLPGMRLLVPLGPRQVTGYLLGETEPSDRTVKKAREVLDPAPLFPAGMVPFFRWLANYYHYPIGEIIKTALPAGLTSRSGRTVTLTDSGRVELAALADPPEWLATLLSRGKLSPAATAKLWGGKDRRKLEQWQVQGLITIDETLQRGATLAKSETCVSLDEMAAAGFTGTLKPSERKTLELLAGLDAGATPVTRIELIKLYATARQALTGLAAHGLISLSERPVYRDHLGEPLSAPPIPEKLTPEQVTSLAAIDKALQGRGFSPFLLHGVTGCGKTEIYLRAAATTLAQGRTTLVLVPEIALATQVEAHFLARFGDQVALLHSGLTTAARQDQWRRIAEKKAAIVIGARSGIYAPLDDLGLIIVDEEHDPAYKQEDGFRYQARDLAVLRGRMSDATVILGSATPSLASYTNALHGKYRLLSLEKRIEDRPLPEVEIVDLPRVKTVSGHPPLFSPQLTQAIRATLQKGEQSLVFLNRRGYSNLVVCAQCGQPVQCRHCQVSLTLHQREQQLLCHYCGYTAPAATICPNCQSGRFTNFGFGTERLEAELAKLFPNARIGRLDRDTSRNRQDFINILKGVHQGEIDILIGTQMITKGHHFPNVTLVGVVWADAGLGMPDYKAGERTFQLLSQVTGRAGRGEKPGRVLIQTHQPEHYSIVAAMRHDYQAFYHQELSFRRQLGFPPFSRLINLGFDAKEADLVQEAAREFFKLAQPEAGRHGVQLLGPAPAVLAKLHGRHRWQLLLKGNELEKLHGFLGRLLQALPPVLRGTKVKLTVDVDPESMV